MNYEEMSDIVIDRKIFSLMFGDDDKDMERIWKNNKFRPCSQPDIAWPIIVDNRISLNCSSLQMDGYTWQAGRNFKTQHRDKNPLRAAMICFLKMKDAECKN